MADAHAIVAGAGPGGLMSALTLAGKGFEVLVVERKPRELVGRPLCVSIEKDVFTQVSLEPPQPPELIDPPLAREIISPDGKSTLKLRNAPLITVSMRAFINRLLELCEARGVRFLFETPVSGARIQGGRVTGVVGTSADGRLLELEAPLSIDASGITGILRHNLEAAMGVTKEIDPRDVTSAWQETREFDRETVLALMERGRIRPQVSVSRVGLSAPYSLLSIYVDMDNDHVELTAGVHHHKGLPTARDLVDGYVESHEWVGQSLSGGGGLLPVRRPLDNVVAPGFACVGDAACQCAPLHASGVSAALVGGMVLGEVAASALEKGKTSRDALWPYNYKYMEARGAAQANSGLFRRFILTLSTDDASELFTRSLVNEEAVSGTLEGMALEVPLAAVIHASLSLWKNPGLLRKLARLSRDSVAVLDLYADYPERYDEVEFERWRKRVHKLFDKWKPIDW